MVENGRKSIKMKAKNENIAGVCVCSMRIEFNSLYNVQFYRIRTFFCADSWKRIKTVGRERESIDAFRWRWKRISVDRALL